MAAGFVTDHVIKDRRTERRRILREDNAARRSRRCAGASDEPHGKGALDARTNMTAPTAASLFPPARAPPAVVATPEHAEPRRLSFFCGFAIVFLWLWSGLSLIRQRTTSRLVEDLSSEESPTPTWGLAVASIDRRTTKSSSSCGKDPRRKRTRHRSLDKTTETLIGPRCCDPPATAHR